MYVHGSGVSLIIVAPGQLQQLFPGKRQIPVAHQNAQQHKFLRRKRHLVPGNEHTVRAELHMAVARSNTSAPACTRRSTASTRASSSNISKGFTI